MISDRLAPTLNAPADFAASVRRYIVDFAETQREAMGRASKRERAHFAALAAIVEHLTAADASDPRMAALAAISSQVRQLRRRQGEETIGGRSEFQPTGGQRRLLTIIGDPYNASPAPGPFLAEFLAVGVTDLCAALSKEGGRNQKRARDAEDELEKVQAELDEANTRLGRNQGQDDELATAREEIAELRQTVETLRSYIGDGATDGPRRERVETGVYVSRTAKGQVFEVCWREDGRTKWKRVGPDLEEARKARAELTGTDRQSGGIDLESVFDRVEARLEGRELTEAEID